jgi:hypothetical protein
VHQFIAALRQLRHPIVLIAIAILVLQTMVAGLATGHAVARIATFGAHAGIICHGNGADDFSGADRPAHDCCTFCTAAEPAAWAAATPVLERLDPLRRVETTAASGIHPVARAIRAGSSRAPPTA